MLFGSKKIENISISVTIYSCNSNNGVAGCLKVFPFYDLRIFLFQLSWLDYKESISLTKIF
jgi:hypothetical protein